MWACMPARVAFSFKSIIATAILAGTTGSAGTIPMFAATAGIIPVASAFGTATIGVGVSATGTTIGTTGAGMTAIATTIATTTTTVGAITTATVGR